MIYIYIYIYIEILYIYKWNYSNAVFHVLANLYVPDAHGKYFCTFTLYLYYRFALKLYLLLSL